MEEICMVRPHTCVSVHCDQCADTPAGPGFEAHYPDETTAMAAAMASDWLVAPDGRLLCSTCGPVLVCEADGHEFGPWRSWSAPNTEARREYRNCRRCCLHESRTAPTLGEVA
jgi:hypothetical protein